MWFHIIILILHIASTLSQISNDDCGIRDGNFPDARVTAGEDASDKEFPWMVSFQGKEPITSEYHHFCGGSIINEKYILTAAHCFVNIPIDKIIAVTDGINLKNSTLNKWQIEKVISHESFDDPSKNNDIALVKLKQSLKPFNSYRRPICLPVPTQQIDGNVLIAGWGYKTEDGKASDILQKAKIKMFNRVKCNQRFGLDRITSNMICAGSKKMDSCKGDSGGPLMKSGESKIFVGGIVSFGYKCGRIGYPGVYTKVTNYIEWIQKNIQ